MIEKQPNKPPGRDPRKNWARIQLAAGLLVAVIAELLMFKAVEPVASNFYLFIWWAYILTVDAVVYCIQGNSLILSRTREFLLMMPWSVAFWLLFEMLNLRLENWYYANVTPYGWIRWPGYFFSYATVLPGIFETMELLACLGLFRRATIKRRIFSPASFPIYYAFGILFFILPLAFPHYFFPLVWIAFIFLLDPINYVHGSPSLIRDWEEGTPCTFYLLLTAGLICGGLWEFWNFWAHTKWIYTVPFFEELKLFEMPAAGFLGFPPFAVECYVMYNVVSLFRGHRTWLHNTPANVSSRPLSRKLIAGTAVAMVVFYALAFRALDRYTVNSYITPLGEIPFLPPEAVSLLHQAGVQSASDVLDWCAKESNTKRLVDQAHLSEKEFLNMVEYFRLASLEWMGVDNVVLLQKAGVSSLAALVRQDPRDLHHIVHAQALPGDKLPSRAMIRLWIRSAQAADDRQVFPTAPGPAPLTTGS